MRFLNKIKYFKRKKTEINVWNKQTNTNAMKTPAHLPVVKIQYNIGVYVERGGHVLCHSPVCQKRRDNEGGGKKF